MLLRADLLLQILEIMRQILWYEAEIEIVQLIRLRNTAWGLANSRASMLRVMDAIDCLSFKPIVRKRFFRNLTIPISCHRNCGNGKSKDREQHQMTVIRKFQQRMFSIYDTSVATRNIADNTTFASTIWYSRQQKSRLDGYLCSYGKFKVTENVQEKFRLNRSHPGPFAVFPCKLMGTAKGFSIGSHIDRYLAVR